MSREHRLDDFFGAGFTDDVDAEDFENLVEEDHEHDWVQILHPALDPGVEYPYWKCRICGKIEGGPGHW